MSNLYLDIETNPTTNEAVIERLTNDIHPPANYKTESAISKWWAINGEAKKQEVIQKTALDPLYGSIRCIGYAIDDDEPEILSGTEEDMLHSLMRIIIAERDSDSMLPTIIGHNVVDFDLQFIRKRAIINQVPMPMLERYLRRYSESVQDTMRIWAGYRDTVSLENLAQGLLGRGKSVNGAGVFEMSDDECEEYCKHDVRLTRDVYKMMSI